MLELKRVSTGHKAANVIHGIDLTGAPGEIVARVGANGAGKSTLVKVVVGLLALRAGSGKDLLHDPAVTERYLGVGKGVNVADAPRHQQMVRRLKEIFAP
ncbi:MAG: ATP-binding cassette domain-containing protein [Alphaproteobacteria bacterium]|nr:ATP-binding cassette domain-containing protein [Alphaproteobacteria bacterium]